MSKISPNIWEYPSDMWKLFRKETPLGKALALALQESYTKGHMDDQLAKTCLTGFDKAVVKVIRSTNNNVEQLEFSAKCLANYRINDSQLHASSEYWLKEVEVSLNVKPKVLQMGWLRDKSLCDRGFAKQHSQVPEREVTRRLNLMKHNYIKIHLASVRAIKLVVDNPFKGGNVKISSQPQSRFGVKTDEFGDRYLHQHIRDNIDPYREFVYVEKIERLAQSCGKEPQRLYQEQEENNVPHRYRNSNTFKRHRDSNSNLGQVTSREGTKAKVPSGVTNRSTTKGPSVRSTPKHIRGPINLKPGPSATPKQAVREAKDRDPGTVKSRFDSDDSEDVPLSSYREEQERLLLAHKEKKRKEMTTDSDDILNSLTASSKSLSIRETAKATKPKPKTFVKDEIVIECYITRNVKGKTKTGEDTWRTNTLVFKLDETPHRTKESFDELEDTINVRVCVTGSSSKNRNKTKNNKHQTTVLSVDDGSGKEMVRYTSDNCYLFSFDHVDVIRESALKAIAVLMEKTDPDEDEKERQSEFKQWTEDLDKQIQLAKDFLKRKESEGGQLSALAELTNPTHIPTKKEEEQKRLMLEKRLFEEQRKEEENQRKEEGRQRKENLVKVMAAKLSGLTGLTITKRNPTVKEKQDRLQSAEKEKKREDTRDSDCNVESVTAASKALKPTAGKQDSSVEILSSSDVEMKEPGDEEVWIKEPKVKQEILLVEDNGSADSEENEGETNRDSPPALKISEVKSLQTGRALRSSSDSSS